jgi:L-ascorbate metabolism protein UlaG (beta-lactamase superfamily)
MGDTDIFGDMALIEELHKPDIGIVPIGDRLTMGGAVAALACRRYFNFDKRSLSTTGASPSSIRLRRNSSKD